MPNDPKLEWKFPVHSALSDRKWTDDSVERMLRSVYTANPILLNQPDEEGLRPIAVAAVQANFDAIKVMMEVAGPKMAQGEDVLGLQLCDNDNETAMSHNLLLLRQSPRFMIHDILDNACKVLREGYIKNKLPKCTCGKCAAGWLSPRMRFRLREIAHDAHVSMLNRMDDFVGREALDDDAVADDPFLPFLPPAVIEQGVYKSFYLGYRTAFQVIADILSITEAAPTATTLHTHLLEGARTGRYNYSAVEFFNERGGSVRHALDYVIHQALWSSPTPLGDGSFDLKWDKPLPYPDPRKAVLPKLEPGTSPNGRSPSAPGSPMLSGSTLRRILSHEVTNASRPPIPRQRSSSFRVFGRKERTLTHVQIKEDDSLNHARQWKLKEEWEACALRKCPLDTQFRGVRYLMGLHTPPRWDADEAVLDGVIAESNTGCELKRMSVRF